MENAVVTQEKPRFTLTPTNIDEALRFAEMLSKSALVPKEYQGNPGNILVAMQWGLELGLQPLQAMQNIAVINGRPAIWGDAMLALVKGSGLLEAITEDVTESEATCTVKRRGEPPVVRSFSVEDAKRAGLYGKQGPWQQYPKRMLQMRARAWALRDVFPDVLRGIAIAEEAADMPREKDVTAEAEAVTAPAAVTRAEQIKARLADRRREQAADAPTLSHVIAAIESAKSANELNEIVGMAAKLESADEKDKARAAYKEKLAALKSEAQDVVN